MRPSLTLGIREEYLIVDQESLDLVLPSGAGKPARHCPKRQLCQPPARGGRAPCGGVSFRIMPLLFCQGFR